MNSTASDRTTEHVPRGERNNRIRKIAAVALTICACLAACPPVGQGAGGAKTVYYWVDIVDAGGPYQSATVVSTMPATSSGGFVQWPRAPFTPIVITPTGSSVTLLDDPQLTFGHKNGVNFVTFYIQDIPGPDGIMYETDPIPIRATVYNPNGYVVHLRVDNVRMWRDSNHLGGKRVQAVGTVSFGDVVFTRQ